MPGMFSIVPVASGGISRHASEKRQKPFELHNGGGKPIQPPRQTAFSNEALLRCITFPTSVSAFLRFLRVIREALNSLDRLSPGGCKFGQAGAQLNY
jgi:hypothetical protein